eukprot:1032001-Heterocapsa_arctica.AAC.1
MCSASHTSCVSLDRFRLRRLPDRIRGPPLLSLRGLISLDAKRASPIDAFALRIARGPWMSTPSES